MQLRRRVLQDYFSGTYLISRPVFIWPVLSSILKLIVQNTMKDQQNCNVVSSRVIL